MTWAPETTPTTGFEVVASGVDGLSALVGDDHGPGQKVSAEHVEDFATLVLLEECGVDAVQGYYIRRPDPIAEVLAQGTDYPIAE
jgi:EAL domain-containing protein (putative c-di-GMP-specific phosphodiesterase class I)